MEVIKVLIADDHKMFRDGIRALLHDEPSIEIIDEAADGEEVVKKLATTPVNVILMDIEMPNMNGLETTEFVSEEYPDIQVLVLSMSDEEKHVVQMIKSGARGYILKNTGKQELIAAIKTVAAGDSYFSKEVSQKIFNQFTKGSKEQAAASDVDPLLTEREVEILRLIAEEQTNQEIADQLYISIRTVDTHRRNLLQKLNVKNTAGLVKYAISKKLI